MVNHRNPQLESVPLPRAVAEAMTTEAAAQVIANERAAMRLVMAHFLVACLGSLFGTSIAIYFWMFAP